MKKQPLALTVSLILFCIVTLVLGVQGYLDYQSAKTDLQQGLQRKAEVTLARLAYSLSEPMWDFDNEWAFEVLATEMLQREVAAIKAVEKDGSTLFAGMIRGQGDEPERLGPGDKLPKDCLLFTEKITHKDKTIGKVTLCMTTAFLQQKLDALLQSKIVTVLVVDLLVILGLFVALRAIVIKPVLRLQSYATRVGAGELECSFPEGSYPGELGKLEDGLVQMVCNLKEHIDTAKQQEAEAQSLAKAAENARSEAEKARENAVASRREGMVHAASTLEGIVSRVEQHSSNLAGLVNEVSQGSQVQSERVSQTAASMQEMNAAVLDVARNASEASQMAENTRDRAGAGNQVVDTSADSIKQVDHKVRSLHENMDRLESKANDIGNVINVINDIADQTNLLALNAAIEAARAGEAGRGFAVVADEVRKLAEKTMTATKEVTDSITAIQEEARKSLEVTASVAESVEESTTYSDKVKDALHEITDLASSSSEQISVIATAAEEQSATTEEISASIEEINRIADETSSGMDRANESISELVNLAGELSGLVEKLKES
jgi:methyl-accepting chemotaxis protein